jgi:hypothetical protein
MRTVDVTSRPNRTDIEQTAFDAVDGDLEWIARALGARGMHYPALIPRSSLERAGYSESFPHLLLCASHYLASGDEQSGPWCLSPAVCYHVYEQFAGTSLAEPQTVTARGLCFRSERETAPGIRQIEFEMREIVFLGRPEWVKTQSSLAVARVTSLAERLLLSGAWHPAEDPFFLPTGQGRAFMQRLLGVKEEYRAGSAESPALASVNRHGTFFGERFDITDATGAPVHTACVAIGLDRWCAALAHRIERSANVAQPSPSI